MQTVRNRRREKEKIEGDRNREGEKVKMEKEIKGEIENDRKKDFASFL